MAEPITNPAAKPFVVGRHPHTMAPTAVELFPGRYPDTPPDIGSSARAR